MELRRGFKSEASDIAREVRGELGLGMLEQLDPWLLAEHLAIPGDADVRSGRGGSLPCQVLQPGGGGRVLRGDGVPWIRAADRVQRRAYPGPSGQRHHP